MRLVFQLLVLCVGISQMMVACCPKQCQCGKTYHCSVKDLTTLQSFLPHNVTRLDLSSQGITKVPDNSFVNYTELVYLSLANNSIRSLTRHSFRGLQNLQELHLQYNGKLDLNESVFSFLRSLKHIHLEGNDMDALPAGIFNLTRNINITKESKIENIHCNFYKKPLSECIGTHIPKCQKALDLEEKELVKFKIEGCARALCKVKQTGKTIKCYMTSGNANETSWSILGGNSAVKLALWTFGLLAVASNSLVLLTLLCNREARKSALCVFVMNLLLGNILIGSYIVILSVSDTMTYGNFQQYGEGRWEMNWCIPLFFVKTIGLLLVVLSLVLVSIERVLVIIFNSPNHIDCCRSVGYVMESWLVAGVVAIVLWTKTSTWGYLCSTHDNSKDFIDINKGIKMGLFAVCVLLVLLYVVLLCRLKRKAHKSLKISEYRTTMRMFLLLLSTLIGWAALYMVMVFVVPIYISITTSMQVIAISLTVNACLHPFIFSCDNDNLENLYSALACKSNSCLLSPLAVQGQFDKQDDKTKRELDLELDSFPHKKQFELCSVVEMKQPSHYAMETCTRLSPVHTAISDTERGAEVSKGEGAVIIRNKSPTGTDYQENCTIVVHSTPSSPDATAKGIRPFIDEHSECGTLSSDTNVTWISSDCPSNTHARIGDGNSTTSSRASSIPLGKSAASPHIRRKRLSSVKSDSERSEDDDSPRQAFAPITRANSEGKRAEQQQAKDEPEGTSRKNRPMSPVEIICRVLSPKMRKKRPKTGEGLPGTSKSIEGHSRRKRSKSMLLGREAKSAHVQENVLDPLPPVTLRERKPVRARDRRNGVLVVRNGEIGLEIQENEVKTMENSPTEHKHIKDLEQFSTYLVNRPVNSKSMLRLSNKDKTKRKLNRSLSEPAPTQRVKIYENPVADLDNNNQTNTDVTGQISAPTSPTRRLAKLEEGDTVPELPRVVKAKCRNSTSSTSSSLRLSSKSLEWDPSYTEDTYSDADVLPPTPTAPPLNKTTADRSSARSSTTETGDQVKGDSASRYSLEWDPTGVQMRLSVISQDSTANQDPVDPVEVYLV